MSDYIPRLHVDDRENRLNKRLEIANRTEAMRDILAAEHHPPQARSTAVAEALTAIIDGTPYPDWLIAAIRPDLREAL